MSYSTAIRNMNHCLYSPKSLWVFRKQLPRYKVTALYLGRFFFFKPIHNDCSPAYIRSRYEVTCWCIKLHREGLITPGVDHFSTETTYVSIKLWSYALPWLGTYIIPYNATTHSSLRVNIRHINLSLRIYGAMNNEYDFYRIEIL